MSRKRWIKRILAGVVTLGSAGGCKQQLFLEPGDYIDAVMNTLPRDIENHPHDPITPSVVNQVVPGQKVSDVLAPDRPARMISLRECVAIALEQGATGNQVPTNFGFKVDVPNQFTGRAVTGADSIRVFAVDPATQSAELERSLSKFDAQWINSMTWQKVDTPTAAQFLSFQNSRDAASLSTTLAKPLPTGGVAAITFADTYSKFATVSGSGFVNPNYIPQLQFTFEQPILRLFGVEANELSPTHPGSTVLNLQPSGGTGTEGILISRIRVDQQKAEFDLRVNYMLANVETAYWNLYAAYYNLYANEEGLRQAFEGFRFISTRVEIGSDPSQNAYQARAQFERFRRQVYQARGQVLEAERQLRGMLNLRSDDGTRLVPIDKPNEVAYHPDFYEAANEAMAARPELLQARQDLKANQLNLLLQKNLRRPDLRVFGQYDIEGLGTRLDGSLFIDPAKTVPGNALASLANNKFNNWTLGARLTMPIGFRDANAQVREAQLAIARSYYQLRDSELKVLEFLVQQYRRVIETHAEIGPAREERKALQIYLGKVQEVINIGRWDSAYFQNYLTVQEQLAAAISTEFAAVAAYNQALAQFEFAKGTIQQYNNVSVNEGPLPPWAQKKATDHIRERTEAALKLRERDIQPPPGGPATTSAPIGPPTGSAILADLPPFAEKRDPLPGPLPELKLPDDPKKAPDPIKIPPAGMGGRMLPPPPTGLSQPLAKPTVPLTSVPPTGAGTNTPPEDYFHSIGIVSLPPRGTSGAAGSTAPTPPPARSGDTTAPGSAPTQPLSAGTGMAPPLPIPPISSSLPVPPATPDGDGFGPAKSLPVPPPPDTRYPAGK